MTKDHIHTFEVDTITSLSDHRPLNLYLKFRVRKNNKNVTPYTCSKKKDNIIKNLLI